MMLHVDTYCVLYSKGSALPYIAGEGDLKSERQAPIGLEGNKHSCCDLTIWVMCQGI